MIAAIVSMLLHIPASPSGVARSPLSPAVPQARASAQSAPLPEVPVRGVVRDESGAVIAGAVVFVRSPSGAERYTVTDVEGRFLLAGFPADPFEIIVRTGGFGDYRTKVTADTVPPLVEVTLSAAGQSEEVTVAATRVEQRIGEVAASLSVLTRDDIRQSPAVVADDVLRQLPAFSLFRRTSSLAAHPGAQGVSLRGIGSSGVSRTLVLLDGVPLNDPFGGWVYWSRVPIEGAERIEVIESASSSVYGNYAMGGLINIMTPTPSPRTMELRTQYGSRRSPKLDVHASDVFGRLGVAVDVNAFDTDGYLTVVQSDRGPVDMNSAVTFKNANIKFDYAVSDRVRAFLRTGYFSERRDNGKRTSFEPTVDEGNDTKWTSTSGGVRLRLPDRSEVTVTAFTDRETFHSNNITVPFTSPVRTTGRLTLAQTVPSTSAGAVVQWTRPLNAEHVLTGGFDWRWVDGESDEIEYGAITGTTPILSRAAGGTQESVGGYLQDLMTLNERTSVTLSARVDRWINGDGFNRETNVLTGLPTVLGSSTFPRRSDAVVSPRAAVRYHLSSTRSVWASVGTGFRAPTLNELYRSGRAGSVQVLANGDLGPERLLSFEGGASLEPRPDVIVRATVFDSRVNHPVSNVTINQSGADVTQLRQNLGRTRSWGVESDVEYRLGPTWRVTGAYLFGNSRVTEYAPDPTLVGKYLVQVPRHRASVLVAWSDSRWVDASVSVQMTGNQFDDDQNVRGIPGNTSAGLPGYAVVGVSVSRRLDRNVDMFLSAQNLFDQQYFVGTLPTLVGPPRMINAGLRMTFRGR